MALRFMMRDLVILALSLALWAWLAAYSAGGGALADLSGWVVGLMLGVCAYLAHEWSHYLGALAMGAKVTAGQSLSSPFLFSFDAEQNSVAQFFVMSVSGFLATALVLVFFYQGLPDEYLASRVARGGGLFLALLGLTLEVPLLLYGLVTRSVPKQVSI